MDMESHLVFRKNREVYKKLGLALSWIPSLAFIYMFGVGGLNYVKVHGEHYVTPETAYLPENILAIGMATVLVPIIFFFVLGGFLATRFARQQFEQLESGRKISFNTLLSGYRRNYTKAHIIHALLFMVCVTIFIVWKNNLESLSAIPFAEGPGGGSNILRHLLKMGIVLIVNLVVWLIITLPVSYVSAFILRSTSLKSEFD